MHPFSREKTVPRDKPEDKPAGALMSAQARTKPDDTRARIMETAEALFRRLGYAKTAVADIAAELRMSPANVYRFFPSKSAIVEAICQRCLGEIEQEAWATARSRAPASARLEQLFTELFAYHSKNLLFEKRVHDIVLVAIEQNWEAIRAHKETLLTVVEFILREGIEAGEIEPIDSRQVAALILRAMVIFTHPQLIAQCMQEGDDLPAEIRASLRFLLSGITARH